MYSGDPNNKPHSSVFRSLDSLAKISLYIVSSSSYPMLVLSDFPPKRGWDN